MTPVTRLASAAVVAVLAVGGLLYVTAPRLGVSTPAPTATPMPTPAPVASACLVEPVNSQLLADDCTYLTQVLGIPMSIDGTGHFMYQSAGPVGVVRLTGINRMSGADQFEIFRLTGIPSSPCADALSETPADPPASSTAYIAWLQRSPLAGVPVTDVSIGGLSGARLDVPVGSLESAAPSGAPCRLLWLSLAEGTGSFVDPRQESARINVLDSADGVLVVVEHSFGVPPGEATALADQLSRIRFGP